MSKKNKSARQAARLARSLEQDQQHHDVADEPVLNADTSIAVTPETVGAEETTESRARRLGAGITRAARRMKVGVGHTAARVAEKTPEVVKTTGRKVGAGAAYAAGAVLVVTLASKLGGSRQ